MIPHEEAVPACSLGVQGEFDEDPGIATGAEVGDVDAVAHDPAPLSPHLPPAYSSAVTTRTPPGPEAPVRPVTQGRVGPSTAVSPGPGGAEEEPIHLAPAVAAPPLADAPLGGNRDFWVVLLGQGISSFGDAITNTALPILVLALTGSGFAMGVVGVLSTLPDLVDRPARRRLRRPLGPSPDDVLGRPRPGRPHGAHPDLRLAGRPDAGR